MPPLMMRCPVVQSARISSSSSGSSSLLSAILRDAREPIRARPRQRSVSSISSGTGLRRRRDPGPICFACRVQQLGRRLYSSSDPAARQGLNPRADGSSPIADATSDARAATLSPETRGPPGPAAAAAPPPPPPPTSAAAATAADIDLLPSTLDARRSPLARRLSTVMDNLQARAATASATINDLTGYTAIERLKQANERLEAEHAAAQAGLRAARAAYKALNTARAATQREVAALLARRDGWTPADLERFTALYRADHAQEARVAAAGDELSAAEAAEERASGALSSGLLRRYHEEQVWSDRIRRQSTWGTWGLMAVNVVLFLALQFVAEPWRRARLVRGVVAEEKVVLEELRREVAEIKAVLAAGAGEKSGGHPTQVVLRAAELPGGASSPQMGASLDAGKVMDQPVRPLGEIILEPGSWAAALAELGSDRKIDLRVRDVSLIALESVVAGAAAAALAATLLLRRT